MFEPGDQLGGFEIIQKLGEGGMGIVYLAKEPRLGRRVALKLIAPNLSADEEFALRFDEEARSAAAIEHPNAVPIYSAGEADGHLYLAMRYIDGTDLRAMLRRDGTLSPQIAAQIIGEIGGALDAAHGMGLVHRDVKPANILVEGARPARRAYLTDFGLTKGLEDSRAGLTGTGRWVGTLDYVAPEQMHGNRIDARTDVYALGCVLYESLTGRIPFHGTDVQKMWAHFNDPIPPLELASGEIGARLDPVIQRATSKDPEDRFPSAGDLGRAAQSAVEGTRISQSERSVATGAAAVGLTQAAGPTGEARRPPEPTTRRLPIKPAQQPPSTEPRPAPPTETARQQSRSGSGVKIGAGLAGALVLAAGLVAGALIVSKKNDSGPAVKTVVQTSSGSGTNGQQSAGRQNADSRQGQQGGPPGGGGASSETTPTLVRTTESHCACSLEAPADPEWSSAFRSKPNSHIFQTTYDGSGGEQLLVDWTPIDEPSFGGDATSTQTISQPNFGSATEYSVAPGGTDLPSCSITPCTEIIVKRTSTSGWAVVAGGFEDPVVSQDLAQRVATSIGFAGD